MQPKILFSKTKDETNYNFNGGCDSDACSTSISLNVVDTFDGKPKGFLQRNNSLRQFTLDKDYKISFGVDSPTRLVVTNTSAQDIMDSFLQPQDAAEWLQNSINAYQDAQLAVAQLYEAGFLREVSVQPKITNFHHTAPALESWLYLTRACNLACAHCFVNKDVRRMGLETGLQAVDRLFELAVKHGHPKVKIKYAGGEPTMNWDLIPALHERAKLYAKETRLNLTEVLVTNATLLNRERLQFIKDENFRLSISLDGFGEGHDRQRPARNGNPTFERVFKSILVALEAGLSPYLIITITSLNFEEVPTLVAFALKNHLMLNLNFYRPHHVNDPLVADNAGLICMLQDALKIIETNLPDYNFMEGLIDRSNFGAAHQHVCGAGRNYLSIDTDGSFLPCHMLTGYNLPGIPLQMLASPRFDDFSNPPADNRNGCDTCEWRYWCGGGCPIHVKNLMGTSNVSSPYCGVYKSVYPELVRLQGLQLLQADLDNE